MLQIFTLFFYDFEGVPLAQKGVPLAQKGVPLAQKGVPLAQLWRKLIFFYSISPVYLYREINKFANLRGKNDNLRQRYRKNLSHKFRLFLFLKKFFLTTFGANHRNSRETSGIMIKSCAKGT